MNKEIIEKYIQFAIDNWFKIKKLNIKKYCLMSNIWAWYCEVYIHFDYWENNFKNINLIELITSKEFINAVASWIINEYWFCTQETYDLTIKQALAIRDNKLEEFILSIIK